MVLTVKDLEDLQSKTLAVATSREEYNTGYSGNLFRYVLQIGESNIRFQIDLLPNMIKLGE